MICSADTPERREIFGRICSNDIVVGTKMLCRSDCGLKSPEYLLTGEDGRVGALGIYGGVLCVAGDLTEETYREAVEFGRFFGATRCEMFFKPGCGTALFTDADVCRRNVFSLDTGVPLPESEFRIFSPQSLKSIHKFLRCELPEFDTDYDDYLAEIMPRINRSLARVFAVCDSSGEPAATASVLFCTADTALLGAVVTRRDLRGKKYGRALVSACANSPPARGKTLLAVSENSESDKFYTALGFSPAGTHVTCVI